MDTSMITEINDVTQEVSRKKLLALHDELLKAESEVARLRTTFNNVREGLENLAATGGIAISFEDAASHVRRDYGQLLQKLSQ